MISCSLAKMGIKLKPKKKNLFRNVVVFLRWQPRGYGKILYGIVVSVSAPHTPLVTSLHVPTQNEVVKLREREGQRVDLGRSLKGHL